MNSKAQVTAKLNALREIVARTVDDLLRDGDAPGCDPACPSCGHAAIALGHLDLASCENSRCPVVLFRRHLS